MSLLDKDRIFTNLYGMHDRSLAGARKRGHWDGTAEILARGKDTIIEQVKASGRDYKVGSFPFVASARARAMEASAGFCKVIAAKDDDEILGVHIIGPMAGELIAEAVLAMEYSASTEDLQRTMHAHPTLSEALHEAALAADKRAIDFPNR